MASFKSGHKVVPVTGEEAEKQKEFLGHKSGTIRLQPDGWFLSSVYQEYADRCYEFEFKPNDIVIMTYPKCGTTWTQEIIWTLLKNPNLDSPDANVPLFVRSPFMEFDFIMKPIPCEDGDIYLEIFKKSFPDRDPGETMYMQFAELADEPRIIKTHLPFSLLSPKLLDTCKVIYVARDPKDVSVSFLHHSRLLTCHDYVGSNEQFHEHFVNDALNYSPFWTHLKEAWEKRDHPNLHYCFFEDLKADPKAEIIRLQKFVGVDRTEEQINNVVKYTDFSAMKAREQPYSERSDSSSGAENKFVNVQIMAKDGTFFRKGVTGDWKKKLTMEQADKIQKWTKANVGEFGPDFKYQLLTSHFSPSSS